MRRTTMAKSKNVEDDDITLTTKDETTGEIKTTSNTVTITAENKGDTANVTLKNVHIQARLQVEC